MNTSPQWQQESSSNQNRDPINPVAHIETEAIVVTQTISLLDLVPHFLT
jgi:hypothetical protein